MSKHIIMKNICFSYKGNGGNLTDINLDIQAGEAVVITGPSGSGKSTLIRIINGLIPHFYEGGLTGGGQVGKERIGNALSWERGKYVGSVFQDPRSQFFANEVAGEIAFGCENYGFSHEQIIGQVNKAAQNFEISDILSKNLHQLSYGMRQKVALASAYAIDPDIFVLDEPSANLDIKSTENLEKILLELKTLKKTVIIAEHRLYYLMNVVDRIICMQNGKIVAEYTPRQIMKLKQDSIEKMGLRSPNLINSSNPDEKRQCIRKSGAGQVCLETKNINLTFQDVVAAENISLSFEVGEVVAIVGPNGAGKSTFGKILAGLQKEEAGTVALLGKCMKKAGRRKKIWFIMQDLDSQLFGESVLDELLTGKEQNSHEIEKAKKILERLDLSELTERHPSTLSGGQKQRLALAIALMYDAKVIIMDEPTSGLDGGNMRRVSKIVQELAKQGHTILIITHDAEFAYSCCQRVIRLQTGKVTDDIYIENFNDLCELMDMNVINNILGL